uniref:Flavodoxin-like fold domain-containing protein n=1 Tax=Acanthochromis polyacanthus TaxID=80966 RepID=A0A3Q1GZV2_9TELE
MKTALIVFAHQTPASFNATARDVAVQELSDQGYRVLVSDLYAMKFRAEATRDDIKGELKNPELFQYGDETMFAWMENQLSEDITAEQQKVTEAELIIFQVREDKPHLQLWLLSVSLWLFCASLWSLFAYLLNHTFAFSSFGILSVSFMRSPGWFSNSLEGVPEMLRTCWSFCLHSVVHLDWV